MEDLRQQMEDNSSLAGRALREELDKAREEQERRHQVEHQSTRLQTECSDNSVQSLARHSHLKYFLYKRVYQGLFKISIRPSMLITS